MATLGEVADYLVREYGRSILDDRLGMAEVADNVFDVDIRTDDDLDRLENLVRVKLGLPAAEL